MTTMRNRIFSAVSIDSLLCKQIKDQRFTGRVHSVFQHAVNIELDHLGLVTIVSPQKHNGPAFIKACPFPSLRAALRVRSRAVLTDRELVFPSAGVRISLDDARPWRVKGSVKKISGNEELLRKKSLLDEALETGIDGQKALDRGINELSRSIASGNPCQIKRGIDALIGLGDGLTPAGDDVLLGLVCFASSVPAEIRGCKLDAFLKSFSKLLEDYRDSTTFISYSFLKYGLEGRFIEPLSDLCRSILSDGRGGFERSLEKILSIGANSGSSMLRGIVLGINLHFGNAK